MVVLSHHGWTSLFGGDPSVVGRSFAINGAPFRVVGVMPADFRGLSLGAPDYWAPLSVLGTFRADRRQTRRLPHRRGRPLEARSVRRRGASPRSAHGVR